MPRTLGKVCTRTLLTTVCSHFLVHLLFQWSTPGTDHKFPRHNMEKIYEVALWTFDKSEPIGLATARVLFFNDSTL